jgi:hypothetical protein
MKSSGQEELRRVDVEILDRAVGNPKGTKAGYSVLVHRRYS